MDWKKEWKIFAILASIFLIFFYLPVGTPRFDNAVFEALYLAKWYAREHVIFCLIPAFFIAGAIGVFISQQSVMKYLGAKAKKVIAYGVASVSGSVLAVCSCTVLPLFAGIYRMGAGLGPAVAFLYSGPAINVLAIILSAKVLGIELGVARAVGAISFSIIIGLIMHLIYRKEEIEKANSQAELPEPEVKRSLWQNVIYFALMVIVLVFANWGKPDTNEGFWFFIYNNKWIITSIAGIIFSIILVLWFEINWKKLLIVAIPVVILALIFTDIPMISFAAAMIGLSYLTATGNDEMQDWFKSTWEFSKQILPLLFWGVLVAGFALGRPGYEGIIPSSWISTLVGGNSLFSNFFSSVVGAFMYFATLTEVPIVQGLLGSGMGKGPALALLLAGPALSLPNMLVIRSVMGTKKTVVYVSLVVIMSTITGYIFGLFYQ
ncbi:MAG TPA: permease [Bacteroidota bacterium]|nr:permease [Bacteroidota bacterium]